MAARHSSAVATPSALPPPAPPGRKTATHPLVDDMSFSFEVSELRVEAGRKPPDRGLSDLVGQLSTRSDEFGMRWAAPEFGFHRLGDQADAPSARGRPDP